MDTKREILTTGTYALKSRFQVLLVPIRDWLISHGYSANQVTVITAFCCVVYSFLLVLPVTSRSSLLLLPVFLLLRMALNALDGMIATKTNTSSALGVVLNETGDVISDLFLFGAFAFLLPIPFWLWLSLILLSIMIEFVSLVLFMAMAVRPNSGPFSKSDRAVYLGLLALLLFAFPNGTTMIYIYAGLGLLLALITLWNRMKLLTKTYN